MIPKPETYKPTKHYDYTDTLEKLDRQNKSGDSQHVSITHTTNLYTLILDRHGDTPTNWPDEIQDLATSFVTDEKYDQALNMLILLTLNTKPCILIAGEHEIGLLPTSILEDEEGCIYLEGVSDPYFYMNSHLASAPRIKVSYFFLVEDPEEIEQPNLFLRLIDVASLVTADGVE